jgi:hypothetical protein
MATAAVVPGRNPLGQKPFALFLQFFWSAIATVGASFGQEFLGIPAVDLEALGLAVRPVSAGLVRPFVPIASQPAQVLQNHPLRLCGRTLHIGILQAQDKSPLLLPGIEEVEKSRTGVPHM